MNCRPRFFFLTFTLVKPSLPSFLMPSPRRCRPVATAPRQIHGCSYPPGWPLEPHPCSARAAAHGSIDPPETHGIHGGLAPHFVFWRENAVPNHFRSFCCRHPPFFIIFGGCDHFKSFLVGATILDQFWSARPFSINFGRRDHFRSILVGATIFDHFWSARPFAIIFNRRDHFQLFLVGTTIFRLFL